jgi:hypothetical protein
METFKKYAIQLVLTKHQNIKISELRNYFYTSSFRYKNSTPADTFHVTLIEFYAHEDSLQKFIDDLPKISRQFFPIKLFSKIKYEESLWVKDHPDFKLKFPDGCSRLFFDIEQDETFTEFLENLLILCQKHNLNSREFIENIEKYITPF